MDHFGTLRNAYRLIGYTTKRDCGWIDTGQIWADVVAKLAHRIATAIEKTGEHWNINGPGDCVSVNGKLGISFRVARWWPGKKESHSPRWAIHRRKHLPTGWVVAIRLAETNKAVLDYLLLPTSALAEPMIKFTEKARVRFKARRFETVDALIRSIVARTTRTRHASTKSTRSKGPRAASRSKSKRSRTWQ